MKYSKYCPHVSCVSKSTLFRMVRQRVLHSCKAEVLHSDGSTECVQIFVLEKHAPHCKISTCDFLLHLVACPAYPPILPVTHSPTNLRTNPSVHTPIHPLTRSPTRLPTYPANSLPIYQPTNRSMHKLTNQCTHQATNLPTYQPSKLTPYPPAQPTNLTIQQPPNLPTYRSTNLPTQS